MEDNFSTHTKIEENLTADEEVFISYSRVDKEFVWKIIRVLKSNGYSVWVDTESILPTSIWSSSIANAIDNAAATIFVITDASLKSVECKKELDYAFENGKKIIPLIIQNPGGLTLPEPLNSIQGIVWNTQSEEQANIDKIIAAIKLNLDWYNWHAGTLEQSQYWNKQSKNKHLLMRGSELLTAERWLDKNRNNEFGLVTDLQLQYIVASRLGAAKRLLIVALPALALAIIVTCSLKVTGNMLIVPGISEHGIVDLELAKSSQRTAEILAAWYPDLIVYAVINVCLDFLYIVCYVLVLGLFVFYYIISLKRKSLFMMRVGVVIFIFLIAAGIADVLEGYFLLSLMLRESKTIQPMYIFTLGVFKFAAIVPAFLYILLSFCYTHLVAIKYRTQKVIKENTVLPKS